MIVSAGLLAGRAFSVLSSWRREHVPAAGFAQVELTGADELNRRYFSGRRDGLELPSPGLGMLATARVMI